MKQHKNKAILLLGLLSMFFLANPVKATSLPEVENSLKWIDTNRSIARLNISSSKAVCSGIIKGASRTSKISADIVLEKKAGSHWATVKAWSRSANSNSMTYSVSANVTKGYVYRSILKVTTVTNGKSETNYLYSRSVRY